MDAGAGPLYDLEADYLMDMLVEEVQARGVRRLVLDSSAQLERSIGDPVRVPGFLAAFVSFLRGNQVTTYLTLDR